MYSEQSQLSVLSVCGHPDGHQVYRLKGLEAIHDGPGFHCLNGQPIHTCRCRLTKVQYHCQNEDLRHVGARLRSSSLQILALYGSPP